MPSNVRYHVWLPTHRFLGESSDPRVVPTLLHFFGTAKSFGPHRFVVDGLVKLAPERIRPHVLELARRGVHRTLCIEWLRALGGAEELVARLAAHGEAPIHDRAIDVDQDTRHQALKELADRKDPTTFVSLVHAYALDACLRERAHCGFLPFSWRSWKELVPEEVLAGSTTQQLAWAEGEGKAILGEQTLWPQLAPIVERGPAKVAESYPAELIEFDASTLAALLAEETAIVEAP